MSKNGTSGKQAFTMNKVTGPNNTNNIRFHFMNIFEQHQNV
jgi:hypothetical protein